MGQTYTHTYPYPYKGVGRAGAAGEAISFVAWGDFKNLCAIESRLNHIIKHKEIDGFPVRKLVPVSILNYVRKSLGPSLRADRATSKPRSSAYATCGTNGSKRESGPNTRTNKHIWG